ncbi:hypothetical protein NW756_014437 [Fusarium oxysporum]|nr:hypothetical protein NW756_014437 [Fusarium oxysporum]
MPTRNNQGSAIGLRRLPIELIGSAHLKITRIFISPSPRNIDVLLGVANHDIYRKEIKEIIWDDSPLESIEWNTGTPCCHDTVDEWSEEDNSEDDAYAEPYSQESEERYEWYVRWCRVSIMHLKSALDVKRMLWRRSRQDKQLESTRLGRRSFADYKSLLQQQEEALKIQAHEKAFLYALERFPNLTTIEVTPAAHGQLYMPLYTTPMIRELPYGFPYPIPRGWPCPAYNTFPHDVEEKGDDWWRSFRFVIKALANMDQCRISELVLDNHYLPTGINPFIFTNCADDYNNLCKIVEKLGFNRLVLSLITGWIRDDGEYEDWEFYRNGSIRKFLAKASDFEEMVFKTDYNLGDGSLVEMRDYVSFFDLFPLDAWHFGLVGMQVTQKNLISFLRQLPSKVRSIDLSFLAILEGQGTHEGTLTDIRDKLGWRSLPLEKRISIRYLVHGGPCQRPSPSPSYICLNKEVEEYVYEDGPLPVESSRHPRNYNDRNAEGMGVEEVIWDDATLIPLKRAGRQVDDYSDESEEEECKEKNNEARKCFAWYTRGCKRNIKAAKDRMVGQMSRPDTVSKQHQLGNVMSYRDSFEYYKVLESQQRYIIASKSDEGIFRHALQQFPKLKRVIVTPAAHGYLLEPLYETPMIRSFPYGFIYPVPRGYPTSWPRRHWAFVMPWIGDEAIDEDKIQWHGFRIVTKVLAEENHKITELIFDDYQPNTGISRFALNRGTEEYTNFCDMVKRPGLQKLQLSLLVSLYIGEEYEIYDQGYLRDALSEATDMRHFSFHTDFGTNRCSWIVDMHQYTSLFDVFPIHRWQKLTHFGLSNVVVAQNDFINFLSKLPPIVLTVELSFLTFMEGEGHYISLMEDIHDKLDWKHRPVEERIRIYAKIFCYLSYYGRYICLDKEVEEFVYKNGPPSFQLRQRDNSSNVDSGTGVLKDLFNASWERLNDFSPERRLVFPRMHGL